MGEILSGIACGAVAFFFWDILVLDVDPGYRKSSGNIFLIILYIGQFAALCYFMYAKENYDWVTSMLLTFFGLWLRSAVKS